MNPIIIEEGARFYVWIGEFMAFIGLTKLDAEVWIQIHSQENK